ncbi:MAG: LysM peptidoglycan-binding domain-containing protein [Candidatus Woesearchaeota archaeon]
MNKLIVLIGFMAIVLIGLVTAQESYTVKEGDTLSEIAQDKGVTLKDLREANDLQEDESTIHPEQELNIPDQEEEEDDGGSDIDDFMEEYGTDHLSSGATIGASFSQLFFGDDDDDNFVTQWRSRMGDFFAYNKWGMLLFGDVSGICNHLIDISSETNNQGLFMDLGGGNQALGLSISGEVWEYTNTTRDKEYLYKVTYYAYNPNEDDNRFNIKFCADSGCSDYEWWFSEHKELASYGSYSGTGNNKIVAYHDKHFPKVCVVLDDEIRIWDDDATDEFCNRLVLYNEDTAPASTNVGGSDASGSSGDDSDDSGYENNFR